MSRVMKHVGNIPADPSDTTCSNNSLWVVSLESDAKCSLPRASQNTVLSLVTATHEQNPKLHRINTGVTQQVLSLNLMIRRLYVK